MKSLNMKAIAQEFKDLDPKDPGTWGVIPRSAALTGIFSTVLLLGWLLVGSDLQTLIESERSTMETKKTEFLAKKKQAVNLAAHQEQLEEINRSFGKLLKQLPSKSEVDNLLIEVNQAGLGRGLHFDLFKPSPETVREFYAELPVAIAVRGSYEAIGMFVSDVGKLSRVVTIEDIQMGADAANSKAKGELVMNATLKTFRYLDEQELAQQRELAKATKNKVKK